MQKVFRRFLRYFVVSLCALYSVIAYADPVPDQYNLFYNNQFDDTYIENGFIQHWSCQGEENVFRPMLQTLHHTLKPSFSGVCTERTHKDQGPGQLIQFQVKPDQLYKVRGWTRLLHGKTKKEKASIELWLRWKPLHSNKEEKKLLGVRNKFLNNNNWVEWNSQFHLPSTPGFQYVIIYFKGPANHIDILVADMSLYNIAQREDWIQDTNDRIDSIRKRDVSLKIEFDLFQFTEEEIRNAKLEIKQISNQFGFGASVHHDAVKNNAAYRSFIKSNFEWVTTEHALKWPYMERTQGVVDYSMADEMLKILIDDMGLAVRGHCIFWAVPEEQPTWLMSANSVTVKASLKRRLYDILERYKDRINMWDVNNEMLHGSFFGDKVNETVRDWMYFEAHKMFPDGKLFVNDYEVLSAPWYTQSYIEQIQKFQLHGIPIGGIGVQGHFNGMAHPEILKERLDALAVLGLPIWITELDAKNFDERKRANVIEKVLRVAFAHPAVHGVMLWSFWNKHDWRGNTSLFDGKYFLPNEAGKRYLQLRDQWKSNIAGIRPIRTSPNSCSFNFRVFHGSYILKVTLPDDSTLTKVVDVLNDLRELMLVFRAHQLEL